MSFYALRDIAPGEECTIDYGRQFCECRRAAVRACAAASAPRLPEACPRRADHALKRGRLLWPAVRASACTRCCWAHWPRLLALARRDWARGHGAVSARVRSTPNARAAGGGQQGWRGPHVEASSGACRAGRGSQRHGQARRPRLLLCCSRRPGAPHRQRAGRPAPSRGGSAAAAGRAGRGRTSRCSTSAPAAGVPAAHQGPA